MLTRDINPQWRFRTGWRGALVLQRYITWTEMDSYGGTYEAAKWRDATTEDLIDYLKEIKQ